MELNNIESYAIILIYSDGSIENIKADNRKFHMEYFLTMINNSNKLKEIIDNSGSYIPDEEEAKLMLTYEIDTKLAQNKVIAIHNLFFDEEAREDIDDWQKDYYISFPSELTDIQKEIILATNNKYDLSSSWFCKLQDNKLIDISYLEMLELLKSKIK